MSAGGNVGRGVYVFLINHWTSVICHLNRLCKGLTKGSLGDTFERIHISFFCALGSVSLGDTIGRRNTTPLSLLVPASFWPLQASAVAASEQRHVSEPTMAQWSHFITGMVVAALQERCRRRFPYRSSLHSFSAPHSCCASVLCGEQRKGHHAKSKWAPGLVPGQGKTGEIVKKIFVIWVARHRQLNYPYNK